MLFSGLANVNYFFLMEMMTHISDQKLRNAGRKNLPSNFPFEMELVHPESSQMADCRLVNQVQDAVRKKSRFSPFACELPSLLCV